MSGDVSLEDLEDRLLRALSGRVPNGAKGCLLARSHDMTDEAGLPDQGSSMHKLLWLLRPQPELLRLDVELSKHWGRCKHLIKESGAYVWRWLQTDPQKEVAQSRCYTTEVRCLVWEMVTSFWQSARVAVILDSLTAVSVTLAVVASILVEVGIARGTRLVPIVHLDLRWLHKSSFHLAALALALTLGGVAAMLPSAVRLLRVFSIVRPPRDR
jgi:hypothetical protein